MKTELNKDEEVIKTGSANMQRNVETVGGKLFLTNSRIIFEAHKINVQRGAAEIALDQISNVERSITKFLGILPIASNSIKVTTADGKEFGFVVYKKDSWIDKISNAIKHNQGE